MKELFKIILALVLTLALGLTLLTACGEEAPPPVDEDDGNYVYKFGTVVRIVKATDTAYDISDISNALLKATGKMPSVVSDESATEKHEIVIGNTEREITRYALEYLDSLELSEGAFAWCVYAYDNSVAVVWTGDHETVISEALDYLLNSCLNQAELAPKDGAIKHGSFDYAASEKEREAAKREAQLVKIADKLGEEAAEAMREYLTLFDENFYIWLANLYDPETGALYYSNSGRDNEGFLPDIESTTRGFGWLEGSGMTEKYANLGEALPDWLKEKLAKWLQGLQSPEDGYFYHPQWQKNINDSRKSRDLDNATSFLTRIGADILYDTTNGYKGIYGAPKPAAYMTSPLGTSVAVAVSAVVSASSGLPEYLTDTEKFREFILGLDWEKNSYSSAHQLESLATQIKNAGAEYVGVYEETVNGIQEANQEKLRDAAEAELLKTKPNANAKEIYDAREKAVNGLWEDNVRYDSINGLMKVSSTYSRLGIKMNYVKEAFESALSIVELETADPSGKSATNIVDIYNPWCCLNNLLANARNFGDADTAAELRATITERSAELIRITRSKVSIFRKDDGSYGYMDVGVPEKSQGALVAVKGTDEGDVNGGTIATTTVIGHMCGALGVSTPSLYFNSDFEKFMDIIENATPIEKIPAKPVERVKTFDDLTAGSSELPSYASASMNTGALAVIEDPRGSGNVVEFKTLSGANSHVKLDAIVTEGANCNVLEWDMNITESKKNTTVFQIRLGNSYMLTVNTGDNGYTLGDSSRETGSGIVYNSFDGTYSYGQWYRFRVEQWVGTAETTVTNIYVDGKLVGTSNNYVGKNTGEATTPDHTYTWARFFALQSPEFTALFDNIVAESVIAEKE